MSTASLARQVRAFLFVGPGPGVGAPHEKPALHEDFFSSTGNQNNLPETISL